LTVVATDLTAYYQSPAVRERIDNLLAIMPRERASVLDIGARNGYISGLLAERYAAVTALDLVPPERGADNVMVVQGDATLLCFPDNSFDIVLCAEVLEHIPPELLKKACNEIARVARYEAVIGVPYRQDLRLDRLTCGSCGKTNPPWGHLNTFHEDRLKHLFEGFIPTATQYVGKKREATNTAAVWLLDLAGNPWGPYDACEAVCMCCGMRMNAPSGRGLIQRAAGAVAVRMNRVQSRVAPEMPCWIHMVFSKTPMKAS